MSAEQKQIRTLVAIALVLGALLFGYNAFFSPQVPVFNETSVDWDAPSSMSETEKLDINTATLEELCTLKGIGEGTAKKILAYREANDGFVSVRELMEVDGIGEKTFAQIEAFVTVKSEK